MVSTRTISQSSSPSTNLLQIHLPSLGCSQAVRQRTPDLDVLQSLQIGRLGLATLNAKAEVLLVTPQAWPDEMDQVRETRPRPFAQTHDCGWCP